jgi:putative ABC transport system permease protein
MTPALLRYSFEELRLAARRLRRTPGFVGTVVITLGLGIGANVAMFETIDRLMFRPLAYLRDPGTVHRIYLQWQNRGATVTGMSGPYTRLIDLQKGTSAFSAFAGFSERDLAVGEGEDARELRVSAVSASYFDFFEARPALGRFFTSTEDTTPAGADVAVLSHAFWQSSFGGRNVVGERLVVSNIRATIIGVAPQGFNGVNDAAPPMIYVPITTYAASTGTSDSQTYFTSYQWGWMHIMVRRRPGVTVEQAQQDATLAFQRSWMAAGIDNPVKASVEEAHPRVVLGSPRPGAGPDPTLEARTAVWLGIVAMIVLVIACANVMNLMLARALERTRDTAVRIALGVTRQRLALQSVAEGVALALMSGVFAMLVAMGASALIDSLLLRSGAGSSSTIVDARVLAVAILVTLVAGVAIGLVPALVLEGGDISRKLRGGSRGGRTEGSRLRSGLLVVQAGLSVMLLVGATLFVRSLDAVRTMRLGYDADRVLYVRTVTRGPRFEAEAMRTTRNALMAAATGLKEVESAAWVSSAPFVSTSNTALFLNGVEVSKAMGPFTYQATTEGYFKTMGTRILRGRGFTADDRLGAPNVAVVGESMARALWPSQEPLGRCFHVREETAPCTTIVGIAEDMVQRDLVGRERYHYYLPIDQFTRTSGNALLLRLRGDPGLQAEEVRKALQRVMPGTSYVTSLPLREIVRDAQRSWRMGAALFLMFGALALIVAAFGLRGAISYNVTQRAQELSVRMAIGAQRTDIIGLVVSQSALVVGLGVAAGSLAALAASRFVQPLLFEQSATEPGVYAFVALVMLVTAISAAAAPALRASRTDPAQALRSE